MLESAAISQLKFPFSLKEDQIEAVNAWIDNDFRGTVLYSTGTGKTEIALECAKRFAFESSSYPPLPFLNILLIIPRIILIEHQATCIIWYIQGKNRSVFW